MPNRLVRLMLGTVLVGLLLAPVAAEQVFIRNKPFKGATSGKGAATMVELGPLAQVMGLTARQGSQGGWCVTLSAEGPPVGEELATPGKVIVEGKEVASETRGDVVLVNLKEFSAAVGARFQINSSLNSIDVNLASKPVSSEWSTPSSGSSAAPAGGLAPIRVKQKTPGERFNPGPWMQANRTNIVYFTAPW
ncbi:MAG: hypothetical protein AB1758_29740 [Candidatus Eremiobacterota bacterium]